MAKNSHRPARLPTATTDPTARQACSHPFRALLSPNS